VLTVVVDYYVSKIPGRGVMIAGTVAEGTEPVTGTTIAIRAEGHALVTALVRGIMMRVRAPKVGLLLGGHS
jgi:phosphotransferase system IIA component